MHRRSTQKSSSRRFLVVILLVILVSAGIYAYKTLNTSTNDKPEGGTTTISSSESADSAVNQNASSTLTADLNKLTRGYPGVRVAVFVVDLDNGAKYDAGESKTTFVAASITKILAAVGVLREVDSGRLSLDKYIDGSSVSYLLQTMIRDSNNQS